MRLLVKVLAIWKDFLFEVPNELSASEIIPAAIKAASKEFGLELVAEDPKQMLNDLDIDYENQCPYVVAKASESECLTCYVAEFHECQGMCTICDNVSMLEEHAKQCKK